MKEEYSTARDAWQDLVRIMYNRLNMLQEQSVNTSRINQIVGKSSVTIAEYSGASVFVSNPGDAIEIIRQLQRQTQWVYPSPEELRSAVIGSQQAGDSGVDRSLSGKSSFVLDQKKLEKLRSAGLGSELILQNVPKEQFADEMTSLLEPPFLALSARNNGKLEVTVFVPRCDVFVVFPALMLQVTAWQEVIAQQLGIETGSVRLLCAVLSFSSLHADYVPLVAKIIKDGQQA